jgi:hypothetical protein
MFIEAPRDISPEADASRRLSAPTEGPERYFPYGMAVEKRLRDIEGISSRKKILQLEWMSRGRLKVGEVPQMSKTAQISGGVGFKSPLFQARILYKIN